jgi:hypothetical protein
VSPTASNHTSLAQHQRLAGALLRPEAAAGLAVKRRHRPVRASTNTLAPATSGAV